MLLYCQNTTLSRNSPRTKTQTTKSDKAPGKSSKQAEIA